MTDETSDAGSSGEIDGLDIEGLDDVDVSSAHGAASDVRTHEPVDATTGPPTDATADATTGAMTGATTGAATTGATAGGGPGGGSEGIDPEQAEAIAAAQEAMEAARARLAEVPAEVVVTNHVMGLYELAAIHLSATPPALRQAALAIDAVACLVDGLGDRLGPETPTLRDALGNIRLAFVQIKGTAEE